MGATALTVGPAAGALGGTVTKGIDSLKGGGALSSGFTNELKGGASFLSTKADYEKFIKPASFVGRIDGQFVTSAKGMNALLAKANGDSNIIAKLLGTDKFKGQGLMRMDIANPLGLNPRAPAATMSGANKKFYVWRQNVRGC